MAVDKGRKLAGEEEAPKDEQEEPPGDDPTIGEDAREPEPEPVAAS
jgi:hypothetical protein